MTAKLDTLIDNFDSDKLDLTVWVVAAGISVIKGQLDIPADQSFGALTTQLAYDLTESSLLYELVSPGDLSIPALTIVCFLADAENGNNGVSWQIADGTLYVYSSPSADGIHLTTIYDPAVHKWFRIRETGGVTYWEYSPDGLTWNLAYSEPDVFDWTSVMPSWVAGVDDPDSTQTTTVIFDNINVPPPGKLHYTERNGILVQDGLDPLAGIKDPGPGTCINCGQYIPKLNHHYSQYFGYICLPPWLPNGRDPRPITTPTS